jgi:hypothetical protein
LLGTDHNRSPDLDKAEQSQEQGRVDGDMRSAKLIVEFGVPQQGCNSACQNHYRREDEPQDDLIFGFHDFLLFLLTPVRLSGLSYIHYKGKGRKPPCRVHDIDTTDRSLSRKTHLFKQMNDPII